VPDLSTTYLTLRLPHPFMAGAAPFADDPDTARRLEDGGAAAIVMRSLFEEQITLAATGRIAHMDPLEAEFGRVLKDFPRGEDYVFSPDQYLEHLRRVKAAVGVPVIASLNGLTTESWLAFAQRIEQAGADALELNLYRVVADPRQSSLAIETDIRDMVATLKRTVRIPIAVKLLPFYTALAHFARQLDRAGVDGLILFNRVYHPDIDIDAVSAAPRVELSTSAELLLRLEWLAILRRQIRASLAATGGVAAPADGIKAVLAGADAVQLVSAVVRHGPRYFSVMREGLARWMEAKGFATLNEVRGVAVLPGNGHPTLTERAEYIRTLQAGPTGWEQETKGVER
jgi:dihydroorotate dehydrogenase (fumarate)